MSKHARLAILCLFSLLLAAPAHAVTTNVRSIVIVNNRDDWFYLEEVTANALGKDRASLNAGAFETQNFGPAFGSSVVGAIDDITAGCCGNGVHSDVGSPGIGKAITITFPKQYDLSQLTLHGRQDACCAERLDNVIINYYDGAYGTGNLIASQNVLNAGQLQAPNVALGYTFATPNAVGAVDASVLNKVALANATSLKAQTGFGGLTPDKAIDGIVNVQSGWGNGNPGGDFGPNTAAFETVDDVGGINSKLTFSLNFSSFGDHALGKFRLSATTDNRSQFADGLFQGGDVTANWITLNPTTATSASGNVLTIMPDGSILVTDSLNPTTDIFTINVNSSIVGITGFRLEALQDLSLPFNGPGTASNANFVLTEFTVAIQNVPEPGTLGLALLGGLALFRRRRAA